MPDRGTSITQPSSLFDHTWKIVRAWWGGDVKVCERCGDQWLTCDAREACRG